MPSFVVHAILPLLVLLAVPWLDRRKVWRLWPLTFVPDLDYLLPGLHRAVTGNLFILLPALALAAWGWGRRDRDLVEWGALAATYLGVHILMDVFTGGSVLFWPLTDYNVCYLVYVDVLTATNTPLVEHGWCSAPGVPVVSERYAWLSPFETAMVAFLLPAWAVLAAWSWARRHRTRDPRVP